MKATNINLAIKGKNPATVKEAVFTLTRALLVPYGLVAPGIYFESASLQWLGFLTLVIILIGAIGMAVKRDTGLTIDEARARLDEIERTGK